MSVRTLQRRRWMQGVLLGVLAWGAPAHAGSYLDRAGFLLFEANAELDLLRRKLYDRELARMIHELTVARLRAAGSMLVPKEVAQAHPHLLLCLENCERAAGAAADRNQKEFLKFLRLARDEEQLFRGILKQLGWELPRFG